MFARVARMALLMALLCGCSTAEDAEVDPPPTAPACDEGALALPDGRCIVVGVPPDGCAAGFEYADGGCTAVLPPDACPPGQMAVPGETSCREVAPCSGGPWGDAPIDASTELVDAAYTGTDSDGSEARPWPTVQQAVDAAAPGALVAVAAGKYVEDVLIQGKPVEIWGRCPSEVEIAGTGPALATLLILDGASGTVVRRVAITGPESGIGLSGSDVVAEELWIHDAVIRGIDAEGALGATHLRVARSLLEHNHEVGIFVAAAVVEVEASVIRDSLPGALGDLGRGIDAIRDPFGVRGDVRVTGSLLERNLESALLASGSDIAVDGSVIRDTAAGAEPGTGRAVSAVRDGDARANIHVVGSVFERNMGGGLFLSGSDAAIERSVVRDTALATTGAYGRGIVAQPDQDARATLLVHSSLVERNHEIGIFVAGSDATIEASLVRDGLPNAAGRGGIGIDFQQDAGQAGGARGTIATSLIDRSRESGLVLFGSEVGVDGCVVRDTASGDDGNYGDGIVVVALVGSARLDLAGSRIERSARAAIANFSAQVTLGAAELLCQAFDLNGERLMNDYAFVDLGGNVCGCPAADRECKSVSAGLAPPDAL